MVETIGDKDNFVSCKDRNSELLSYEGTCQVYVDTKRKCFQAVYESPDLHIFSAVKKDPADAIESLNYYIGQAELYGNVKIKSMLPRRSI